VSTTRHRDLGVRLIVLYKVAKAVLEIAFAVGLVVLAATGEIETLRDLAHQLRENLASRWSLLLGHALAALTKHRVHLLEIGLALDGVVSAIEGWALWRGYRWGAWLVVVATASPLPLEVVAIAHSHRPWRVLLAAVNIVVVVYLARQIARSRSAVAMAVAAPAHPRSPQG
jgi:uncharacterized membrane protein (DUF2068 family)